MKKESIVIAGAHPDDLIGSAGLALLLKDQFKLHVLDFTKGELGLGMQGLKDGTTAARRVKEEKNVCALIGATPHFMREIDGFAYASKEVTDDITALFKKLKPRAVITHWPLDRHLDHVMCTASVLKALTLAGLKTATEVYFFEETHQSMNFQPRFYVDISSVWEEKKKMIRGYVCQNDNDCMVINKTNDAVFRGSQILVKYAEAYAALKGELPGKQTIFSTLPVSEEAW